MPNPRWKRETTLRSRYIIDLNPLIVPQCFGCGVMEDQILITETGARSLTPAEDKVW